jgi:type IV pilus assembly protein PilB
VSVAGTSISRLDVDLDLRSKRERQSYMSGRLGELLVRENLISVQQLRKAQEEQQKNGTRISTALIKVGAIEESKLTDFLSKQYGVPAINLKEFDIDPEIIKLVPKDVAEKHLVIPVNRAGSSLIVAMCDPSNIYALDDLKFLTGYNIEPVVASEPALREAIEKYYAEKGPNLEDIINDMEGFDDVEVADDRRRRRTSKRWPRPPTTRRSSSW